MLPGNWRVKFPRPAKLVLFASQQSRPYFGPAATKINYPIFDFELSYLTATSSQIRVPCVSFSSKLPTTNVKLAAIIG